WTTPHHPVSGRTNTAFENPIDILLSLKGEDSYGAGCWSGLFGGFLPQPPYFSGGQRRGFTFGLSARRSFGREEDRINRRKKKAALYPRPERRGFTARTGKPLSVENWAEKERSGLGV